MGGVALLLSAVFRVMGHSGLMVSGFASQGSTNLDLQTRFLCADVDTCQSSPDLIFFHFSRILNPFVSLPPPLQNAQGIPLTVRHVEAVIRMSEAHARMHLRAVVSTDDVDMGVRVLLESFLGTQKYGVQKRLQKVSAVTVIIAVTIAVMRLGSRLEVTTIGCEVRFTWDGCMRVGLESSFSPSDALVTTPLMWFQSFKKYMTYKKDFNVLLLSFLRALVKEAIRYQQFANTRSVAPPSYVDVSMEDLEARVRVIPNEGVKGSRVFSSLTMHIWEPPSKVGFRFRASLCIEGVLFMVSGRL